MLFIKINNIEEFDELQYKIHQNRMKNIKGYKAEKWANPIFGKDKTIICPIEENDLHVLKNDEIPIEIKISDQNYFKFQ